MVYKNDGMIYCYYYIRNPFSNKMVNADNILNEMEKNN